jgi:hypothetical protein
MDYQQAQKIRSKSFASIMTEKLAEGGGIGGSLRATVSEKSQARMKGIKEKFDILNIAKMMTGGSNLAPAILGRLLGRNTRDIKYFAGIKDKRTASKLNSTDNGVSPEMMGILEKIYDFLKETNDEDRLKKQEESQFAEEKELERMRRHKELMEAITGKPYINTYTKVKKEEEGDNTSLMDSLFGKEAFKMLSRLIRFAISPLGLTILGFTAAYELVSWLAENTPDMRIPDASGALAILESGDPKLIAKYKTSDMTGREVLEDIITKGKENAQDLLTDTEGNAADIEKLGGLEAVKKLAAMEIPNPVSVAGRDYADKLSFTKEQFIKNNKKMTKKAAEEFWNENYAPIYNDDGTKRTPEEIIKLEKPSVSAQPELTSMNRTPEQAFQALNENPASLKPEPTYASNVGQKLNVLQGENLMANIFDKTAVAEAVTTNNLIRNNVDVATRGYIPPVRNQEETFQQMILYSTRVV